MSWVSLSARRAHGGTRCQAPDDVPDHAASSVPLEGEVILGLDGTPSETFPPIWVCDAHRENLDLTKLRPIMLIEVEG